MAAGVEYVDRLGVAAVLDHARALAAYLHRALAHLPGARLHSPADPACGTGIVTFSVAGVDGPTLATALRERWQILTRPALKGTTIRTSIAAYTDEADLDRLVEAAATVAAGR
jgi:selenocysteine lyase/cysteine desulfurase